MRSILQGRSRISAGSSGRRACCIFILLSGLWGAAIAQTNTAPGRTARAGQTGKVVGTEAAINGSKEDLAAVERGGKLFIERCGSVMETAPKGPTRDRIGFTASSFCPTKRLTHRAHSAQRAA